MAAGPAALRVRVEPQPLDPRARSAPVAGPVRAPSEARAPRAGCSLSRSGRRPLPFGSTSSFTPRNRFSSRRTIPATPLSVGLSIRAIDGNARTMRRQADHRDVPSRCARQQPLAGTMHLYAGRRLGGQAVLCQRQQPPAGAREQLAGRGERPAFGASRWPGPRGRCRAGSAPFRRSRPGEEVDIVALRGPHVDHVAAPALQLQEDRRLQRMAQVGPTGSVEDRDQPGSTGYDLRGLTMRCRSEADSIHTTRTRKPSSRYPRN